MNGRGWIRAFFKDRWMVFVAAMWLQSCGGIGYLFGSISPVIKSSLKYNQREIARLGVAKDLGDSVGVLAGTLCEVLPMWAALLIGACQNLVGYGWVWLVVTARSPSLPLWAMCILIFVGTNGETYINTAALVSCVQNFPKSRGPVVGILKGFAGLGGAILTQTYALVYSPDHASLIFMVAVGPALVTVALMFSVRPVGGQRQIHPSDGKNFALLYTNCLVLASYLMAVMLLQDMIDFSHSVVVVFVGIMFILLLIPAGIPLWMTAFPNTPQESSESPLLMEQKRVPESPRRMDSEISLFSEVEEEKPKDVDLLPASERRKRMAQLQVRLMRAAAEGAVRVKRRRGPRRGEDFTLTQALIKADFWLIFFSLLLGSGSGLTVIDNMGQMSQSLGYENSHIFVSMISIWNFLGRVGGGYFSEIIVKEHAYPRPLAMAGAQLVMAVGHIFIGMGWPGAMYIGTLMIGLGYGAHWAIVPAAASELFGLKKFGALYNFLTLANPVGSLIFSGVLASSIYDYEAERQVYKRHNFGILLSGEGDELMCEGAVCFFITSMVLSGLCLVATVLSMVLVHRTRPVYSSLYGNPLS